MTQRHTLLVALALLLFASPTTTSYAGTLSCSVATSCPSGTIIYRMSSTTNAHAEIANLTNYDRLVCCTGVSGLGTTCSGTFGTALKLSTTTNAHGEQGDQSNYPQSACLSVPSGGSVSVGFQSTNCTSPVSYDTTLGSLSATTNAHVGDASAYTTKICASATGVSQSLTFSLSDNAVGFGALGSGAARFASGNGSGSSSEVEAHTVVASTNAESGYVMTINGTTLTSGGNTISAIGSSNTASSAGTEQFGMRMTADGGDGAVAAPYAASGFAFNTAGFPDPVASDANGNDGATTYSVRYVGNIGASTEAGLYATTLTYVLTPKF